MTTVHAVTATQKIVDSPSIKDWREWKEHIKTSYHHQLELKQ